jgi:hypothetical protein
MSTSKVRFPVLAYTKRDALHNDDMENEINTRIQSFEETNRTVEVMEDICSLIEYNYSTIIANIRSGMVTNWGEIINNVIEKYNNIVVPLFEKSIKRIIRNNFDDSLDYMQLNFTMNQCDIMLKLYFPNILSFYKEHHEARMECLQQNTTIPDCVIKDILRY